MLLGVQFSMKFSIEKSGILRKPSLDDGWESYGTGYLVHLRLIHMVSSTVSGHREGSVTYWLDGRTQLDFDVVPEAIQAFHQLAFR
jgi:hypothetical protein